jgi:geranylgeranyl diphosphate synthase type II
MTPSEIETALAETLTRHLGTETPPNLAAAIRYSLLAPGKRIRPRLALACASMIGLPEAAAIPAALAIEMVHCFTLIHDDLPCMDDDDFRRGLPSNHKVHGEAIALLAGDALTPLAFDTLADALPLVPPPAFARALRRLAWASGPRAVIGGQAAEALLTADSRLPELHRMHAMKTGALFSAALLLPMDLAGIDEREARGRAITRFADELGSAFQVADDLDDAPFDGQGEALKPTSVLFHQPREQARAEVLQRLQSASVELAAQWGPDAAQALLALSDQVAKSLKGPVS